MKTNIYVDGFNLYYGCLKDTPYRWLDLAKMSRAVLRPEHEINRIRYFTAKVQPTPDDASKPTRQNLYLRALRTIAGLTIHEGHFLAHPKWMPLYFGEDEKRPGPPLSPRPREARVLMKAPDGTGSIWRDLDADNTDGHLPLRPHPAFSRILKFEEKGSDVNLATYLLLDAFRKDFECAVVVSNDSDLTGPIHVVRRELGLAVGVVNPHPKPAIQLQRVAKFLLQLTPVVLSRSQFPARITDAHGRQITKPNSW